MSVATADEEPQVRLVRDLVAALNARDLDAYFALTTGDFSICIHADDGGSDVVAGRSALLKFFDDLFAGWDELRYEFAEGPELIGDCVFSLDHWIGRRGDEDEQTVAKIYAVGSFRGSLCAGMNAFTDRDAALEFLRPSNDSANRN